VTTTSAPLTGEWRIVSPSNAFAQARGDEAGYRDYRDRCRDMAKTLGFKGHIAWAEAMP
jgi:hypothetical protein